MTIQLINNCLTTSMVIKKSLPIATFIARFYRVLKENERAGLSYYYFIITIFYTFCLF